MENVNPTVSCVRGYTGTRGSQTSGCPPGTWQTAVRRPAESCPGMGFSPFCMKGFDRAQICSHILNFYSGYLVPRTSQDTEDQHWPPKTVLVRYSPVTVPLVMKFSYE